MIALDTNIILHYLVSSQPDHLRAKKFFDENKEPLATTSTNIAETIRLLTHPRVFPKPLNLASAVDYIISFIDAKNIAILETPQSWWLDLKPLLVHNPSLKGNEIFDAKMALCLKYNGIKKICTLDADFAKYPFLSIVRI
ncbi:MAG: PIN domain-containing protein [Deltaproteobacteria bacterium]|nr:PIN domain-containing protein [Deltaproteobacteria bacterium]